MEIGFIGLGIMGRPMALNLIRAGHKLTVYNRTPERCAEAVAAGARRADSPRDCARKNGVVITMVTDSPDVEAVLFGPQGAAEGAERGAVFIDMSTISPDVTRTIARRLSERGIAFLDAPVSGGDTGARKGTLTIMVGGEPEVFERVREVFNPLGTRLTHVGPSGAGQVTKACNQILCAVNLLGVCEALALAKRAGIDLRTMHQVVTGGAANSWALEQLGARIIDGDFSPGFKVDLIQKDLALVLDAAKRLNLPLAGTALAHQCFRSNQAHGEGQLGTQALYHSLERLGAFDSSSPRDGERA
jgi:2-hydroxy-3-oxopropionate reductase